jgi:hypothetical protein
VINGIKSDMEEIKCGVPQGSVLGPLLFLIYINDLHRAISCGRTLLFADDTSIFIRGKDPQELQEQSKIVLQNLLNWCISNKLTINASKSCFMVFHSRNSTTHSAIKSIEIPGLIIQRQYSTKFLGVTLDETLSWKEHVTAVCNSLLKYFCIFNYIKHIVTRTVARQLYYAFIYSRISYGIEVLSNCSSGLIAKLQTLQNKLLKLLFKINRRTSTDVVHYQLRILKISDIIEIKLLLFVNDCILGRCPPILDDYFIKREHLYNLRNDNLDVKRTRTVLGSSAIRIYGAKIWNELSANLKIYQNQVNFKNKLTQHYIDGYI